MRFTAFAISTTATYWALWTAPRTRRRTRRFKPPSPHNARNTIVENGKEIKILRDNMPFGRVAEGEFGTYFIGYARSPRTIEQMLENMFAGKPPGNYDRLLDFSRAVTGNLFFVPSATFLDGVTAEPALGETASRSSPAAPT